MNRRNILKSIPVITAGVGIVKIADACSNCEQGYVRLSCNDMLKRIEELKKKNDGVHLLLTYNDIKTHRRFIKGWDLNLSDFDVDSKVFEAVDVIEYHGKHGEFRLFKLITNDSFLRNKTLSLVEVWDHIYKYPIIKAHKNV